VLRFLYKKKESQIVCISKIQNFLNIFKRRPFKVGDIVKLKKKSSLIKIASFKNFERFKKKNQTLLLFLENNVKKKVIFFQESYLPKYIVNSCLYVNTVR